MVLFLIIFYIAVQFQAVMVVNKLLCNEIDYVRYVCVCVREIFYYRLQRSNMAYETRNNVSHNTCQSELLFSTIKNVFTQLKMQMSVCVRERDINVF